VKRGWTPSNWASLKPFGIGEQRPNNYFEVLRTITENRDQLAYAWRILTQGCCDGCALGTTGMSDWTLKGVHLCNIRLRLLRLNTMSALDIARLEDAATLKAMSATALRDLGRLPYPMIREQGDVGFRRITWDEALDAIAERIGASLPERLGFYLTSRGMANENYYVAQKAARAMGTNNIDNAARVCHAPSTTALRTGLGIAATTCSYTDWLASDLIVFIGSNVANNQPVATKYLHYAKKNGAKVAVINNYREPGMDRYWIPSVPESALFGTKIADQFFLVNVGADIAFLNGALKHLVENEWVDEAFIREHTTGFDEVRAAVCTQAWDDLERVCGVSRDGMMDFAIMIRDAKKAVFVWSMGITQHECGHDNVLSIINLALAKGFVGREGCGLMPIRGHSGVQGGAEMGAYASAFPGGLPINSETAARFSDLWGFEVPDAKGITAPEMIDAGHEGRLDVLVSVGGNFLEVLPDPPYVRESLARIPLRVHMDIVLSPQMFADASDTVILLPAATRYETAGGVTQTSTERRVIFSPEIPGPRIGEARPEWDVFCDLAKRVHPERAEEIAFEDTHAIRSEIARVVPFYDGIQHLEQAGDHFQYGGPHLCPDWTFPTDDGKAHFQVATSNTEDLPPGAFHLTTRRGKQFNSMVHEKRDALTGAIREAVLMSKEDAAALGLADGDGVILRGNGHSYTGKACIAPVKPGNVQVHWPEGNVLIDGTRRSDESGVPDYNGVVTIEKASGREI
jgi:molybdopterin-dependent oxidoreductase alpha subunit